MKVEVLTIYGEMLLVRVVDADKLPEEGKQYTVFFETVEPDPVPEFNQ